MGIINTTPDSFSDGSRFRKEQPGAGFRVDAEKVLRAVDDMVAEGAAIVDIGGESTRPGATPVPVQDELERVIPLVEAVNARFDVCVSVDTSAPQVMQDALAAGASLINDVRALQRPGALELLAASKAAVCLMHMQGQPGSMQDNANYTDVVAEVMEFLESRIGQCKLAGVSSDRILVDPGFGFGKTAEHNFRLLAELDRLLVLGFPILTGLSRKSMIGHVTGRPVDQRAYGSVAASMIALRNGAKIIRSHDVPATMDAIRVHCAITKD